MEGFADLTEEELAESLKSGKNKNTIASTKTWVFILFNFRAKHLETLFMLIKINT
jgi:hypothetical protein